MRLTVENTLSVGRPCKVYDADGRRILRAVDCDTETGFVSYWKKCGGAFFLSSTYRPAPLQVVWLPRRPAPAVAVVEQAQ